MPCNSDHMEPTAKERHTREAAQLLVYVFEAQNKKPAVMSDLKATAYDLYGRGVQETSVVSMLCEEMRNMPRNAQDRIMYDGRNRMARRLADWWEEHQAEDVKRQRLEARTAARTKYKNHVFVVKRNSDMTKGRGPMVLVAIYKDFDDAIAFIESESGVMGTHSDLRHNEGLVKDGKVVVPEYWTANDHSVTPQIVL